MGVNDLVKRVIQIDPWEPDGEPMSVCNDLERLACTAWKPVSEPPTEDDGDEHGFVIAWSQTDGKEIIGTEDVGRGHFDEWAKIRDVVLMPPGESG